jgi:hypothetical protein
MWRRVVGWAVCDVSADGSSFIFENQLVQNFIFVFFGGVGVGVLDLWKRKYYFILKCRPGWLSRYSDSIRAGRSENRIPVRARFSSPWDPPIVLYNGYRFFPRGEAAGAWCWPPTPSSAEVKGRVELYIYTLSLWASWPVLGWSLPLPLLYIETSERTQKHCATFQTTSGLNDTAAITSYVARNHSFCAKECPNRILYEEGKPEIIVTICCIRHTVLEHLFISDSTSYTAKKLYTKKLNRVSRWK